MSKYTKYPSYKDSGVEWLGEIPEGWEVKKLKFMANCFPSNVDKKSKEGEIPVKLCNYTDVYYHDKIIEDMSFMKATATKEQIKKFTLKAGDVVITKDSEDPEDIAVATYVPNDLDDVICGYHLSMIRAYKQNRGSFLKHIFDSSYANSTFATTCNGLTRYGLGSYAIDNAGFPRAPLQEQKSIANYLDKATTKIDTLIEKQTQLIELLKEKRQAVISSAVTRGLDASVPMKDSGVEWLGEIPEGWVVKRMKHISPRVGVGLVINPSTYTTDKGVHYIFGGDVKEFSINLKNTKRMKVEDSKKLLPSLLRTDDLVSVRVGYPGITAVVPQELDGANCASIIIIRRGKYESSWLCAAMNSWVGKQQVDKSSYGAAQKQYNVSDAVEFLFPFPPAIEQKAISRFILDSNKRFEKLNSLIINQITLLKEKRTALISAAVTGKIDVRNAA